MAVKDGNARVTMTVTGEELAALELLRESLGVSSVGKAAAWCVREHMRATGTWPHDGSDTALSSDELHAMAMRQTDERARAVYTELSTRRAYDERIARQLDEIRETWAEIAALGRG